MLMYALYVVLALIIHFIVKYKVLCPMKIKGHSLHA